MQTTAGSGQRLRQVEHLPANNALLLYPAAATFISVSPCVMLYGPCMLGNVPPLQEEGTFGVDMPSSTLAGPIWRLRSAVARTPAPRWLQRQFEMKLCYPHPSWSTFPDSEALNAHIGA